MIRILGAEILGGYLAMHLFLTELEQAAGPGAHGIMLIDEAG